MKKIIFLDIDGVLATPEYLKDGQWALNPEKQKLLGELLTQTDAEIVLSSSWRGETLEVTKELMTREGFLFSDKLIGVTIRAYQYLDRSKKIHLSIPRGVEIKQWIDTHIHSDGGKGWQRKKFIGQSNQMREGLFDSILELGTPKEKLDVLTIMQMTENG